MMFLCSIFGSGASAKNNLLDINVSVFNSDPPTLAGFRFFNAHSNAPDSAY